MVTNKQRIDTPARSSARLRGPWLVAARAVWFAVVGLGLVALVAALPVYYRASHTIVDPQAPFVMGLLADDVRLLEQWGFSLGFYAAYDTAMIVVNAAVLNTAAALLFWHRSDDRMAWLISLWLALFGVNGSPLLEPLIGANPAWVLPVRLASMDRRIAVHAIHRRYCRRSFDALVWCADTWWDACRHSGADLSLPPRI